MKDKYVYLPNRRIDEYVILLTSVYNLSTAFIDEVLMFLTD